MTASERLRLVVVGTGSIGSRHARNLATLGGVDVALCDLDVARAVRLADELGGARVAGDLGELLAAVRPHGVLVCTPPASHLAVAGQALAGGAHVFCEKPLAVDLGGVDALLADAARRQRCVMMGMCYRFHAGLRRLHARLREGVVGRVLSAQMWAGHWLPDWHPWADYRTEYSARRVLGGGVLLDSIHSLDTLRWVLGEPVEVMGMLARVSDLEIDTEDVASALVRLAGDVIVEVHVDYLQRTAQSRFEIIGSEGNVAWDRDGLRWRGAGETEWHVEPVSVDPNAMYVAELREFVDCIRTGRAPALDGAEGRATLALAVAIRQSAETGRRVPVDAQLRRAA